MHEAGQELRKSAHEAGREIRENGRDLVEKGLDGLAEIGQSLAGPGEGAAAGEQPVEGVELPATTADGEDEEPDAKEVTDLILIVHGIGQQLATTNEGFSFIYAANIIRTEAQKQAMGPALSSIMRDRQVQFLPIQWRASLKLLSNATEAQEDQDHELDNQSVRDPVPVQPRTLLIHLLLIFVYRYTLEDITIDKHIPYVRELTNSVLIGQSLFDACSSLAQADVNPPSCVRYPALHV